MLLAILVFLSLEDEQWEEFRIVYLFQNHDIKTDLRETRWNGMDRINLDQNLDQWRALVNTVMNLRVPQHFGKIWVAALLAVSQEGGSSMSDSDYLFQKTLGKFKIFRNTTSQHFRCISCSNIIGSGLWRATALRENWTEFSHKFFITFNAINGCGLSRKGRGSCRIWNSRSGGSEEFFHLLRYNAMQSVETQSTLRTTVITLLPASRWFLTWTLLRSWWWRCHVPPKSRLLYNGLHGVIDQNTELFREVLSRSEGTGIVANIGCT
jgi:hypothetical protein